jgi:hypothetical protein
MFSKYQHQVIVSYVISVMFPVFGRTVDFRGFREVSIENIHCRALCECHFSVVNNLDEAFTSAVAAWH